MLPSKRLDPEMVVAPVTVPAVLKKLDDPELKVRVAPEMEPAEMEPAEMEPPEMEPPEMMSDELAELLLLASRFVPPELVRSSCWGGNLLSELLQVGWSLPYSSLPANLLPTWWHSPSLH